MKQTDYWIRWSSTLTIGEYEIRILKSSESKSRSCISYTKTITYGSTWQGRLILGLEIKTIQIFLWTIRVSVDRVRSMNCLINSRTIVSWPSPTSCMLTESDYRRLSSHMRNSYECL